MSLPYGHDQPDGDAWLDEDGRIQPESVFPVPGHIGGERGNGEPALYANVAQLLDEGVPDPPEPKLLHREDGHAIFYAGQVNLVFGDPESGKTLVSQAALAEALRAGRRGAFIDIDHNGIESVIYRLIDMDVDEAVLRDPARFRYVEPEDATHIRAIVADLKQWRPAVAVVDSIGELLPLLRLSSNSPDDFTSAHTMILKPLAVAGACVIAVDHLPKNVENRINGPTGTAAKRRAVGGVSIRVTVEDQFAPGQGGSCYLNVNKDRHGGLRRWCAITPGKEPVAGVFRIAPKDDRIAWTLESPRAGDMPKQDRVDIADLKALTELDPPPESVRDVKKRLRWRTDRAAQGLREWRSRRSPSVPGEQGTPAPDSVPLFPTPCVRERGTLPPLSAAQRRPAGPGRSVPLPAPTRPSTPTRTTTERQDDAELLRRGARRDPRDRRGGRRDRGRRGTTEAARHHHPNTRPHRDHRRDHQRW